MSNGHHLFLLFASLAISISQETADTIFNCDFNYNQCDYWTSTSSTNQWIRATRQYQKDRNSYYSRKISETVMETSVGTYEFATLESVPLEKGRVALTFRTMSFTRTMGRLRIYRKWEEHMNVLRSITPKYNEWSTITERFDCQVSCQVVFEATGPNGESVIHIDDVRITLSPYSTRPETPHQHRPLLTAATNIETFNCNFDENNCNHVWHQDYSEDFNWVYRTGSSPIYGTGPESGYRGKGYYMVMEAQGRRSGEKARLVSRDIHPGGVTLTFVYCMFGEDVGRLRVYKRVGGKMSIIWTKEGPKQTRSWYSLKLTFRCDEVCQVVFEAERGVFEHGDIAIDEVFLRINHNYTLKIDRKNRSALRDVCDFEMSFCRWSQKKNNGVRWRRWRGSSPKTNTGPLGDYTTGKGVYALFQDSTGRTNLTASMESHVVRYPFWRKLRFVYHKLQYNQTSRLNVYKKLKSTGVTELLWTSPQVEGQLDWQEKIITVESNSSYSLLLEAVGGCCGYGDIAIDNVEITSGILPEISNCDFHGKFCRWSQNENDDFNWKLNGRGALLRFRRSKNGWKRSIGDTGPPANNSQYAYTAASYPRMNGDVAILDGPAIGPLGNTSICIRFRYYMHGSHVGKLELTRARAVESVEDEDDRLLWTRSGNQGQRWWSGYVTLPFVNDDVFRLRFKSVRGSGIRGDIAIKNVITDTKPCHEDAPYDCNFDVDMCQWKLAVSDAENWTLARSAKYNPNSAPPTDHTTGSRKGGYMVARLTSQYRSFYTTVTTSETLCVDFWYFSYGSDHNGRLSFWMQPQNSSIATIRWSFAAEVVTWQHAGVTVQSNISYNIGFQAKATDGYKAIDDIRVTPGSCM